jgi:hypothetical protein
MKAREDARGAAQLAVLFAVGLVVGGWAFLSPWVVGFPAGQGGAWTSSTWAAVWVGGVVLVLSALGLVNALGLSLAAALRPVPSRPGGDSAR